MSVTSKLEKALLSVTSATMLSVAKSLREAEFDAVKGEADPIFDSYATGTNGKYVRIASGGMGGKIITCYFAAPGDIYDNGVCPGSHDLVLLVTRPRNEVCFGSDLITKEIYDNLRAPVQSVEQTSVISLPHLAFGKKLPVDRFAEVRTIFGDSSANGTDGKFFNPASAAFVTECKKMGEVGYEIHNKSVTVKLASIHAKHAGKEAVTVVLEGGMGEEALAAKHLGIEKVVLVEENPLFKEGLDKISSQLTSVRQKSTSTCCAEMDAKITKLFPNVIGMFRFVPISDYKLPITYKNTEYSTPISIKGIDERDVEFKDKEPIGSFLLRDVIMHMAPGSVGTFLIPHNFGILSTLAMRTVRSYVIASSEILNYCECTKSYAILCVKRRERTLKFSSEDAERSPDLTNQFVRWVKGSPTFVFNTDLPGVTSGEKGSICVRNIAKVIAPMSAAAAAKLKIVDNSVIEGVSMVAMEGIVRVSPTGLENHICAPGSIMVHKSLTSNGFSFKITECSMVVSSKEFAFETSDVSNRNTIISILENPKTLEWVKSNSAALTLTLDVMSSIPVEI